MTDAVQKWFTSLQSKHGTRAVLRRARYPGAIVELPEVHWLASVTHLSVNRAGQLAILLANVKQHVPGLSVGGALRGDSTTIPRVSEARVERLFRASDYDMSTQLRRLLPQMDSRCDVSLLAETFRDWQGRSQRKLALNYYGAMEPGGHFADDVMCWWHELHEKSATGDRATARRCVTLQQLQCNKSIVRVVGRQKYSKRAAIAAGVVVHIENHAGGDGEGKSRSNDFAERMASGGDQAKVSGLRFRRLLAINNVENLLQPLRRALKHVGSESNMKGPVADVRGLANAIYYWGNETKLNWAAKYYQIAPKQD